MRILVLGDSAIMPRPRQGQSLDDIWPTLLHQQYFPDIEIILRARIMSTTHDVTREFGWFSQSLDRLQGIIIQIGIADCPPRPYPYWIQRLLLTFASQKTQKWVNHNAYALLKLYKGRPWISAATFKNNLEAIVQKSIAENPKIFIILVKIGPGVGTLESIIPGVNANIKIYNERLEEIANHPAYRQHVTLVDPYTPHEKEIHDLFLVDGHHLTVYGHAIVAKHIADVLQKYRLKNRS